MTIEEIFARLATHMIEGTKIHCTMFKAYDFIGLCGYAKCHLYHYMEEIKGYECLLHYYSTHYHKLLNTNDVPNPDIIPGTWYKYNTMEVDTNTKRNTVKTLMEKWVEWERETKKLYQEMYKEALSIGEVAAANKIECYICDVSDELKHAEKKLIKLETLGYDIGDIVKEQQPMYNKYKKRLKHGW